MMGIPNARVVAVDIEIREHNRVEIEAHPMAKHITLIQGSSVAPEVFQEVKALAKVYDEAAIASTDNRYQTVGQLFGAIRQQSLQALPNTALQSMRERLGLVLSQALGTDPAAPLTPATRAKAFETFGRISEILEALR